MIRIVMNKTDIEYIKSGVKTFEVNKTNLHLNNWTKVELVAYTSPSEVVEYELGVQTLQKAEKLVVEMRQLIAKNTFEIAAHLNEMETRDFQEKVMLRRTNAKQDQETAMIRGLNQFWINNFNQGDALYWYDVRLVK